MRRVGRRYGDGISWLAGKRTLVGKDGIGMESVGRCCGDARLSEEGPKLRGLDNRVGRQGQVVKTAARIESVIESSQAADRAEAQEFSTNLIVRTIGDEVHERTDALEPLASHCDPGRILNRPADPPLARGLRPAGRVVRRREPSSAPRDLLVRPTRGAVRIKPYQNVRVVARHRERCDGDREDPGKFLEPFLDP